MPQFGPYRAETQSFSFLPIFGAQHHQTTLLTNSSAGSTQMLRSDKV